MAYKAYIAKLKNVHKHSNADRLQVGECFGNNVVVDLSYKEGDIGVYFPVDGKLSEEFANANNLLRKKDDNGNNIGGYLDPDKRNITAIKLRGEKSDGLFLPLKSLETFGDISTLHEGDIIDTFNGKLICEKYIPRRNKGKSGNANFVKKQKNKKIFPFFEEHIDTEQLAYNLDEFKEGDLCTISLKMHGTSARTSYSIKEEEKKRGFFKRLFNKNPIIEKKWDYVTGTRRVTLDFDSDDKGFYNDNEFRKKYHDLITPKLQKGEEIFYEIVGWVNDDTLIMGECSNSKTKDKEFVKKYGDTTQFTYGCEKGQNDIYVYRMTKSDEDGNIIEYPSWFVKYRCEQMGLKMVPHFETFFYTTKDDLMERVEKYYDGVDPIGKTHIREGVVIRIENKPKFKAYKHKNFYFKVLEGIIKDIADSPDMEEAQDVLEL